MAEDDRIAFRDGLPLVDPTPSVRESSDADAQLFRHFYEDHRDYVWHTLRRLGVSDRYLDDITHDVFVVVHRRIADFDRSRPPKPWLVGIAVREASTFRRKASHSREHLDEPEPIDAAATPEEAVAAMQARELVRCALDRLDVDRRVVFVLHELNGETAPDISSALDVPLNTVYSRLRLARADFESAVRRLQRERR